jgi:hypothetical protein
MWCPKKVEKEDIKPKVPSFLSLNSEPIDSQVSSNKITPYLSHNSTILPMLGTKPKTETNINIDGDSSLNICSK